MNMTISVDTGIGQRSHQGNLTSEDINIIYTALLNYDRDFAGIGRNRQRGKNKQRNRQTDNLVLSYKTGERIHKLSELFRRCGGEAGGVYTY